MDEREDVGKDTPADLLLAPAPGRVSTGTGRHSTAETNHLDLLARVGAIPAPA
ncbi:hypothetical protein [Pseudonocardia pini]|uniref:hypothetical protein n=1 Tax=Pseudonocardia pini TaxID=2758030 RepID=UPI0015F04E0C|nr:hypothetical protein [Pseudonocardia pini]